MDRSLMQLGIADLEALFAKSKADSKVLEQLEHELQHRKVARAVSLMAEVRQTLSGLARAVPAALVKSPALVQATQKLEFRERSSTVAASAAGGGSQRAETTTAILPSQSVAPSQSSLPSLGIEDACKVLKVASGAAWETIEYSRRELVNRAHPTGLALMSEKQRQRVSDEAKRVNLAYATLSAARCERS